MRKISSLLLCLTLGIGLVMLTACPRPEEPINDIEPMPEPFEEPYVEPMPEPDPYDEEMPPEDDELLPPEDEELPPPADGDADDD